MQKKNYRKPMLCDLKMFSSNQKINHYVLFPAIFIAPAVVSAFASAVATTVMGNRKSLISKIRSLPSIR